MCIRDSLEPPSPTSVQNGKPFTVWFVGALDGSDSSRTQGALDGYVDRGVVTPTEGQDAEFHNVYTKYLDMWVGLIYLAKVVKQSRSRFVRHSQWSKSVNIQRFIPLHSEQQISRKSWLIRQKTKIHVRQPQTKRHI